MEQPKVYVVSAIWENNSVLHSDILGVFTNLSDAKTVMAKDIEQTKNDWDYIDFNDPEDWQGGGDELSYEGLAQRYDNRYKIAINKMLVQ